MPYELGGNSSQCALYLLLVLIMVMDSLLFIVAKDEGDVQGNPLWLPDAPLVPRPRASYNAASLAYLGDSIYEVLFLSSYL